MSKVREEAFLRLKNRAERLVRLIDVGAPDTVLAWESYLIMEAAKMLDPNAWVAQDRDRIIAEGKKSMGLCDDPECEEPIAWVPNDTTPPASPFHMTSCAPHAEQTEQEMRDDDATEEADDEA